MGNDRQYTTHGHAEKISIIFPDGHILHLNCNIGDDRLCEGRIKEVLTEDIAGLVEINFSQACDVFTEQTEGEFREFTWETGQTSEEINTWIGEREIQKICVWCRGVFEWRDVLEIAEACKIDRNIPTFFGIKDMCASTDVTDVGRPEKKVSCFGFW